MVIKLSAQYLQEVIIEFQKVIVYVCALSCKKEHSQSAEKIYGINPFRTSSTGLIHCRGCLIHLDDFIYFGEFSNFSN